MSISKKEILSDMMKHIGKNSDKLHKKGAKIYLTGFLGMQGNAYDQKLMVIGIATNGWTDGWLPEDVKNGNRIEKIVEQIVEVSTHDPMNWVIECWGQKLKKYNCYNTKLSPFWRVINKIMAKNTDGETKDFSDDKNWPLNLYWTNLYKISPYCGGNPDSFLRDLQLEYCKELLKAEILEARPQKILMLTGLKWAQPFLEYLKIKNEIDRKYEYVEAKGFLPEQANCVVVVAKHPQGKVQQKYVEEVVAAFEKLNCSESHK
ncbi:MAG: hypothetical protein M1517_08715 [Deltaproteobacteria bacterium]|nr:hypothetical protein [Deltaproteobacteria bacterium]